MYSQWVRLRRAEMGRNSIAREMRRGLRQANSREENAMTVTNGVPCSRFRMNPPTEVGGRWESIEAIRNGRGLPRVCASRSLHRNISTEAGWRRLGRDGGGGEAVRGVLKHTDNTLPDEERPGTAALPGVRKCAGTTSQNALTPTLSRRRGSRRSAELVLHAHLLLWFL